MSTTTTTTTRTIKSFFNNCIAKMEVGCLKYPGASTIGSQPLDWNNAMTGTTAQPSHEPPHQRKGTGTRHTEKDISGENPTSLGGGREGKKMATRTQHEGKTERTKESHDRCSQPPGMRIPKTADLGTHALLVVNSFKLHLNAFSTTVTLYVFLCITESCMSLCF